MKTVNTIEGDAANYPEKVELFRQVMPLFPPVGDIEQKLQSYSGYTNPIHKGRAIYELLNLPYWLSLAPAYAKALALPLDNDAASLETRVEDWPPNFEAQQASLYQLLEMSQLRKAWRSYRKLIDGAKSRDDQSQTLAQLERELNDARIPVREIPLLHGFIRVAWQSLICMPVAQWENMYCGDSRNYEPGQIDAHTVERLATRIAQVFNSPPIVPMHFLQESYSWSEALVYDGKLNHIGDRLQDEYCRRRIDAEALPFPEWRFRSFLGTIRVTLEDGSPWRVAILAPNYFISRLMYYSEWYARSEKMPEPGALNQASNP